MFGAKIYTGIALEEDSLKIARVKKAGNKLTLLKLDQVKLVSNIQKKEKKEEPVEEDVFQDLDDTLTEESIFGFEEEPEGAEEEGVDDLDFEDIDSDLDEFEFEDFEDEADEMVDVDMVDETEAAASNELLLYNILSSYSTNRVDLGLNIPAGNTIFQILKDVDFTETKKKDLEVIVADRLEDLHGVSKGEDYFSYTVRDDGALLLTSVDDEAHLLKLANRTRDMYRGKIFINDILPDEIILLGLIRANYEFDNNTITGVIQFGEERSRVIFLKGSQLWIVSPIINEGIKSKKFLGTIFSKILFQLDTGEVPNLDKIIICNNSLGDEAIEFFEDRFQDVNVSEFNFSDEIFETEDIDKSSISAFTTAIGAAWAASGFEQKAFPDISFLPQYVKERQKIFKLQWHGFALLLLIFLSPIIINHFYTNNAAEIDQLENEINTLDGQIRSLEPVVQEYNRINAELERIQTELVLLDTLTKGTLRWSTNLDILNEGIQDVGSVWITNMNVSQVNNEDVVELQGYALSRNRIPLIADIFANATLTDVSTETIREREVYSFSYTIKNFVVDKSIYSPQSTQGIQELLGE